MCPFFLLENFRPLSLWGPLDFLSTHLGTDSLTSSLVKADYLHCGEVKLPCSEAPLPLGAWPSVEELQVASHSLGSGSWRRGEPLGQGHQEPPGP